VARNPIPARRIVALALAIVLSLAICEGTAARAGRVRQEDAGGSPSPPTSAPDNKAAGNKPATKFVTDETGRHMWIPLDVHRVVSLAPNLTETIYALGLEDKLAADTTDCDTPPAAKQKAHVGDAVNPSLEAIVAMHPDLVFASASINRPQTADALLKLGIPVYTSYPHTVTAMLSATKMVANLMGAGERGEALVAALQGRLDALHDQLQDRPLVHVFYVVWEDPLISIGQSTFVADALRWAGAESVITSAQNWPQVSLEEVVRLQPEYIVISGDHAQAEKGSKRGINLRARPLWRDLRAVKQGHVVVATDEMSRPSPGMVDAIEKLAHQLHPEVFASDRINAQAGFANGMPAGAYARTLTEYSACVR
jgi:iron complex transport system substrate-binding protein